MNGRLIVTAALLTAAASGIWADQCANDRANLAKLNQQLAQDQASLASWCRDPQATECVQQGPSMQKAIATVQEEIAAAMQQINRDCAPVPPPPPLPSPTLTVTDVSPDLPFGAPQNGPGSGGRVHTLAIDPNHNNVLYAVSSGAGVWKSSDSGQSWSQASVGLQNGFAIWPGFQDQELAIDGDNSNRILYASNHDDGRPGGPWGGLYFSLDSAAHWTHAENGAAGSGICSNHSSDITGVTFVSGQPYVATPCGLMTNAESNLTNGNWKAVPQTATVASSLILAPNSFGNTVFFCSGSTVYRLLNAGQPSAVLQTAALAAGNACRGISVVPLSQQFTPDTVAVVQSLKIGSSPAPCGQKSTVQDVTLVSFATNPPSSLGSLGFSSAACAGGSGISAVFAVPRAGATLTTNALTSAGVAYDIFAADGWSFFLYSPSAGKPATWKVLQAKNGGLHADSWSMAFPASYAPNNGNCTAYTSNDAGIYRNTSSAVNGSCDPSAGWVAAMHGLHTLETFVVQGVSQSSANASCPECPTLYLANGDNDVWAVWNGSSSASMDSALGDAGDIHWDPGYPQQLILTRGLCAIAAVSTGGTAPLPGANILTGVGCTNSPTSGWGIFPQTITAGYCPSTSYCPLGPGNPTLTQLLALSGQTVTTPRYFAVVSTNQSDQIVAASVNPPTSTGWAPIETGSAAGKFPKGAVMAIKSSGGIGAPGSNSVLWVLAVNTQGNGQVYQGTLTGGKISQWTAVPGSVPASNTDPTVTTVLNAGSLVVNPYNSNYAWVSDLQDQTIKWTSNGGATWHTSSVLTNIATNNIPVNNNKFRFGCHDALFSYACALTAMSFSRANPNIAVAALYPGGVAYSRDYGAHWAVLPGVLTGPTPALQGNLPGYPISVWYDDNPATGKPAIYLAMHWNRTVRIDGNFDALPALPN